MNPALSHEIIFQLLRELLERLGSHATKIEALTRGRSYEVLLALSLIINMNAKQE